MRSLNRMRHHFYLSWAFAGFGDTSRELRELNQATGLLVTESRMSAWEYGEVGVGLVRAGAVKEAVALLEHVRSKVNPQDALEMSLFRRFEAEVELARGNFGRAVELLEAVVKESDRNLFVESLARAYEKSGATDKAITTYEEFLAMPTYLGWEPQRYWLEAHAALARLYAGRGEKQKAIALLDKLLALWREADPGAPRLLETRDLRASLN